MRWRPQLRFYEERIPILRTFEDDGVLRAFAVAPDSIGARVLDAGHQITVRQDGLSVDLFGQDPDLDQVKELITQAIDRLEPGGFAGVSVRFAHIRGLATTFEEAVARATAPLFPATLEASCSDFAFLMDLNAPGETTAQIEYGIIRSVEARPRLRGLSMRITPVSASVREHGWEAEKFPEVSLFADSHWRQDRKARPRKVEDVWEFWVATTQYAGDLVDSLASQLDSEQKGREIA